MKKTRKEIVFEELEKVGMPNRYIQRSMTITNGAELIINKKFLDDLFGSTNSMIFYVEKNVI